MTLWTVKLILGVWWCSLSCFAWSTAYNRTAVQNKEIHRVLKKSSELPNVPGCFDNIGDGLLKSSPDTKRDASVSSINWNGTVVTVGWGNVADSTWLRVFRRVNGKWAQLGNDITPERGVSLMAWGSSLSKNGTILAVGTGKWSTTIRFYQLVNETWKNMGQPVEIAKQTSFHTINLSGDGSTCVVSSGHSSYVYKWDSGHWRADWEHLDKKFMYHVSLSENGTDLAVGRHLYEFKGGSWALHGNDPYPIFDTIEASSASMSPDHKRVAILEFNTDFRGANMHVFELDENTGEWNQLGQVIHNPEWDVVTYMLLSGDTLTVANMVGSSDTLAHVFVLGRTGGSTATWRPVATNIPHRPDDIHLSNDGQMLALSRPETKDSVQTSRPLLFRLNRCLSNSSKKGGKSGPFSGNFLVIIIVGVVIYFAVYKPDLRFLQRIPWVEQVTLPSFSEQPTVFRGVDNHLGSASGGGLSGRSESVEFEYQQLELQEVDENHHVVS